jgi:Cupin
MATDALSDVLGAVRLAGAMYFDVAARAPWAAEQPAREAVLAKILPGARHLISYHVVTEGHCFAGLIGAAPIRVEAGEVVVFTRGDPHVLSSHPGMRANPLNAGALDAARASPLPSRSIPSSTTSRPSSRPEVPMMASRTGSASSSAWRSANRAASVPAGKVYWPG